jgi:3-oxoadipate enol-lactonase
MSIGTVFIEPEPRLAISVAGSGELLLFLHGIRGNRRNWDLQLPVFAQHFQAAAWDARGYGDSDDYEGALQFVHLIADVLRVAEHFRAEKMHLVGLAMGGRIARQVALRYPERVRTLTLVNTNPGFDALSAEEIRSFITERRTQTAEMARKLLGSRARPGAYDDLQQSLAKLREHSYLKVLEASVAQDRSAPIELITAPTLVLAGTEDRVLGAALPREVARRIPGAELTLMEGAGHFPNLEQPERFNEILLSFLLSHKEI